jgi:hypothetical protein
LPGRTTRAAFNAFVEPLRKSVSCLTDDQLIASSGGTGGRRAPRGEIHALTMANGAIRLGNELFLHIGLKYQIIHVPGLPNGPYKVKTHAYAYQLHHESGPMLIGYHWHPAGESSFREPHIHAPALLPGSGRVHFPSERTSLEAVIRFCIGELHAEPNRKDWAEVLAMNEDLFETYRTWPPQPRLGGGQREEQPQQDA